jgi:hypothetical protein
MFPQRVHTSTTCSTSNSNSSSTTTTTTHNSTNTNTNRRHLRTRQRQVQVGQYRRGQCRPLAQGTARRRMDGTTSSCSHSRISGRVHPRTKRSRVTPMCPPRQITPTVSVVPVAPDRPPVPAPIVLSLFPIRRYRTFRPMIGTSRSTSQRGHGHLPPRRPRRLPTPVPARAPMPLRRSRLRRWVFPDPSPLPDQRPYRVYIPLQQRQRGSSMRGRSNDRARTPRGSH